MPVLVEQFGEPVESGEGLAGGGQVGGVAYVDVGELVVGDGEGAGGPRVEVLHAVLGVDVEQPGAAQGAVDVDMAPYAGDPVLGQHDNGAALGPRVGQQRGERGVHVGGGAVGAGVVGAVALEVVVEVGDVAQGEVGVAGAQDVTGGADDPLGGGEVRARPPEGEQGEGAQIPGEFVVEVGRAGVAVGFLAAVGVVDRAGVTVQSVSAPIAYHQQMFATA